MVGYEHHELDGGEYAGAVAMTLFATFSATLVTLLLLHILSVTTAPFFTKAKQDHNEERVFLRMQLGVFVVCLLVSDLCNAASGLIEGAWATGHMVQEGPACTVQSVLLQFGDVGTAMWNTVVAIHTFMTVVLSKRMSKSVVAAIVVGGWCIVGLLTLIGPLVLVTPERGAFYGVSAQWCFVRDPYSLERILVHYVPMFTSAAVILCLYLIVFLVLRGTLITSGGRWRLNWATEDTRARPATPTGQSHGANQLRSLARKVLWYPVVYILLILPISVCRLASLDTTRTLPAAAGQVSMCFLYSMGFANSLVYAFTRRIGPTPWFARPSRGGQSVQVFVDRITHNDIEGGDGSGGSGSAERGLKNFILSGHSGRSTTKKSFMRKERRSTSGQRTLSPKPGKQELDIDLGVINIRRPKPALHFSADSTLAVMGSMASVPGQPYSHTGSAIDENDEKLDEKDFKRLSDNTALSDTTWIKKEGSDDDVLPSP